MGIGLDWIGLVAGADGVRGDGDPAGADLVCDGHHLPPLALQGQHARPAQGADGAPQKVLHPARATHQCRRRALRALRVPGKSQPCERSAASLAARVLVDPLLRSRNSRRARVGACA
eukprot:3753706-Pyramimonas_sp.AAC.3